MKRNVFQIARDMADEATPTKGEPFFGPGVARFTLIIVVGILTPFILYEFGLWHWFYNLPCRITDLCQMGMLHR